MADPFLPLAVHSGFSLMRGVTRTGDLVRAAKALGYTRLALTDRDNLYALPEFLKYCAREGVEPLIGAELTEPPPDPDAAITAVTDKTPGVLDPAPARVICLVENAEGYANLCRLISLRHQPADFRAAGGLVNALATHRIGLTVLVDDPLRLEQLHARAVTVAALQPIRPQGAFVPLTRAARRLNLPLVAAPDSYFLRPADHATHQILRAIGLNTVLSRLPAHEVAPADAWLAPPAEYARRFAVLPEAIAATQAIGERCAFRGPDRATIFPAWRDPQGRSAAAALRADAYAGARWRYAVAGGDDLPEAVVDRLEHELRCIEGKGFSDYFLYVKDIVRRSPRICGRGSGAASIVAYCLGITNVCPIKFNLYFERFLNPQRIDPPDIDVDFAWDERDGVQAEVLAAWPGQVAMVCNHVLFQPRMAVREVAKVFGLPALEIDRVTERLPWYWRQEETAALAAETAPGAEGENGESLQAALAKLPEMRQVSFPPPWPEILRVARSILGLPRHLSVHSGGVVITPRPVREYVPIETAAKGVPIIHWEKDGTEDMGLVKIDLLGNRSLAVIRDAIANLRRNGESFDELHWQPEDDPATQALVA
ncbi:MAG TPA: PHP domain-containing protein, partial [Planctomycetota bacterium]|nr:PHP domain-containing protein [Planctomycetota bacterium]